MKCEDCGYFWKEDYEERLSCHWEIRCPGDTAPCEDDYYEGEPEEDLEDWELAGYSSEEDYIEDMRAQMWVDAWKNGDVEY